MPLGLAVLHLEDPADLGSFRVLSVNPAAERFVGPTDDAKQAIGKTLVEAFPQMATTELPRRYAEVIRSGAPQVLGDVRLNHGVYAVKVFPLPGGRVGILFDEGNGSRQAEERVRRGERLLARAQHLGRMGSWSWDVTADTLTWSDGLYRIYGLSPETFRATFAGYLERVHADDRAAVETTVRQALEKRQPFRMRERIVRPDGEIRILDSLGDVATDAHGTPLEMFGLCRDITMDERVEQALRESEQRFAQTLQASPAAICMVTLSNSRLIEANARFAEVLGFGDRDQVMGKRLSELGMWPGPGEVEHVVGDLRKRRSIRETTVQYRTQQGQVRHALAALELIEVGGQECMLALIWRT